jgi:hypothetical protein
LNFRARPARQHIEDPKWPASTASSSSATWDATRRSVTPRAASPSPTSRSPPTRPGPTAAGQAGADGCWQRVVRDSSEGPPGLRRGHPLRRVDRQDSHKRNDQDPSAV